MIRLYGGETLRLNKALTANNDINAKAYVNGDCEVELKIIGEIDGVIDTDSVQLNNDTKMLSVQGTSTILENVRVELINNSTQTEATATIEFTSGLELTFTAVGLGAKGNDIIIEFVAGSSRSVDVNYGSRLITITFTYIAGDNANNIVELFVEVQGIISIDIGTVPGTGIVLDAPEYSGQNISYMIEFDGYIYATTETGNLVKYNNIDSWVLVAPALTGYISRDLFIINGTLYVSAKDTATGYYNHILEFDGVNIFSHVCDINQIVNAPTGVGFYAVVGNSVYMFKSSYYIYKWTPGTSEWQIEHTYINSNFYPGGGMVNSPIVGEESVIYLSSYYMEIIKYDTATRVRTNINAGSGYTLVGWMATNDGKIYYNCKAGTGDLFRVYDGSTFTILAPAPNHYSKLISYNNRIYNYYNLSEFNGIDGFVSRGASVTVALVYDGKLYCTIAGYLYHYNYIYPTELLDDQSEQMSGGITPLMEINKIIFNGESLPNRITPANIEKSDFITIRKLSLFDLARGETIPTVTTDMDITFQKEIYSTAKVKENIGILDKNIIKQVSAFPADPVDGQIVVKAGKSYIYKETT